MKAGSGGGCGGGGGGVGRSRSSPSPDCSAIKLSTERPISPFARTRVHACSFRGDRAEAASQPPISGNRASPRPSKPQGPGRKGCSPLCLSSAAPPANTPTRCIPCAHLASSAIFPCFHDDNVGLASLFLFFFSFFEASSTWRKVDLMRYSVSQDGVVVRRFRRACSLLAVSFHVDRIHVIC